MTISCAINSKESEALASDSLLSGHILDRMPYFDIPVYHNLAKFRISELGTDITHIGSVYLAG